MALLGRSPIKIIAKVTALADIGKKLLKNGNSSLGDLVIDGSHAEIIEYSNAITDYPISTGGSVTDHIYNKPVIIKIEGSITDFASTFLENVENVRSLFNGNPITNFTNRFLDNRKKQLTAYKVLTDLYRNKQTVDVVCYWDNFSNMVIEKLNFPRNGETGQRLYFEVTLKQVSFSNVKTVNFSSLKTSVQNAIGSKVKLGYTEAIKPNTEETGRAQSGLVSLYNYGKSKTSYIKSFF